MGSLPVPTPWVWLVCMALSCPYWRPWLLLRPSGPCSCPAPCGGPSWSAPRPICTPASLPTLWSRPGFRHRLRRCWCSKNCSRTLRSFERLCTWGWKEKGKIKIGSIRVWEPVLQRLVNIQIIKALLGRRIVSKYNILCSVV